MAGDDVDAEAPPLYPSRPLPNEPTNYNTNANKLMERVLATPGLNSSLGAEDCHYCTIGVLACFGRQVHAAHPKTYVIRCSLVPKLAVPTNCPLRMLEPMAQICCGQAEPDHKPGVPKLVCAT